MTKQQLNTLKDALDEATKEAQETKERATRTLNKLEILWLLLDSVKTED